jgi:uncharacterized membrane protein
MRMEAVVFTAFAILLYFLSDFLLDRIEVALGRRLEYRTAVFFFLLLGLALLSFWLIRLAYPG